MSRLTQLNPMWGVAVYERDGQLYAPDDPATSGITRPGILADPLYPQGREGMAVCFDCPVHGPRGEDCDFAHLMVYFENPIDGGPKSKEGQGKNRNHWWHREGDTFDTLSLTPSIKFPEDGPEHWHGYVTNGDVQ